MEVEKYSILAIMSSQPVMETPTTTLSNHFHDQCNMLLNLGQGWSNGKEKRISLELVESCKDISAHLVRHDYHEPELCPVENGSIDMTWKGAFCTLGPSKVTITKLHPSGNIDKAIHVEEKRVNITCLKTFVLETLQQN